MAALDDILGKAGKQQAVAPQQAAQPVTAVPQQTAAAAPQPATAAAGVPVGQRAEPPAPSQQMQAGLDEAKRAAERGAYKPYSAIFERLNQGRAPETDEQRAKRERGEKWARIAAAIGGGVGALANMYYTSKGGLNTVQPDKTMSGQTQARLDKLKAEREANEKYYSEGLMRARQADEALGQQERSWRNMLEQQAWTRKQAEDAAARQEKRDKEQKDQWEREFGFRKEQADTANKRADKNDAFSQTMQRLNYGLAAGARADQSAEHQERMRQYATGAAVGKGKGYGAGAYQVQTNNGAISVPAAMLNSANLGRLWSALPDDVRKAQGGPAGGGKRVPKTEDVMAAVGTALARDESNPTVRAQNRRIAGMLYGMSPQQKIKPQK